MAAVSAREVIWHAKRNTPYSDSVVESLIISPEARQIVYEKLVPRYRHRPFFFTRLLRHWTVKFNDNSHIARLESARVRAISKCQMRSTKPSHTKYHAAFSVLYSCSLEGTVDAGLG